MTWQPKPGDKVWYAGSGVCEFIYGSGEPGSYKESPASQEMYSKGYYYPTRELAEAMVSKNLALRKTFFIKNCGE